MFGRIDEAPSPARTIDSTISATLLACSLYPPDIQKNFIVKRNGKEQWEQVEVVANIDAAESLPRLIDDLKARLDLSGLVVLEEEKEHAPLVTGYQMSIYRGDLIVYQLLILQEHLPLSPEIASEDVLPDPSLLPDSDGPRIAFIVDDAGYDLDRAMELLNLRRPMSISVLPKLKYSEHIAEMAHDMGFEVMLHLPMENSSAVRRSPGFITVEMTAKEMYWVIDRDLESIPYVAGINNHQGSEMTRDPEAMAHVMRYLADKKMFFIDSRTTSDSVAYKVARDFELKAAENDVFLDNEKDVEYIKERIQVLMQEAKDKGKAIGICHVHPSTTRAIHEMLPIIDEEGIKLVFASELAEWPPARGPGP